jgi:hypothetical protein
MTDTPVTDSYIETIELAEAYFAGDPRATDFLALDSGMSWYLKRATKIIDGLSLKGCTYAYIGDGADEQERQFPRWIDGVAHDYDDELGVAQVPQAVKDACCEEALALYLFYSDSDRKDRKIMKEDGVLNYNLGGVYSEALGKSHLDRHGLMSSEAKRLLSGYLGGAVELSFESSVVV